jgi:hypothetical protein
MAASNTALNALIRSRADVAAQLERHEGIVRQLRIDLAELDAAILIIRPRCRLSKVVPTLPWRKGGMAPLIFDTLRIAGCSVRELAMHVMIDRGMDTGNRTALRLMTEASRRPIAALPGARVAALDPSGRRLHLLGNRTPKRRSGRRALENRPQIYNTARFESTERAP